MNERTALLQRATSISSAADGAPRPPFADKPKWGATPGLRRTWSQSPDDVFEQAATAMKSATAKDRFGAVPEATAGALPVPAAGVLGSLRGLPGVLLGLILNLMLCLPFGLSFFPLDWDPFPVPRAMGIQMFLFSTFVCQVVMTAQSEFPMALGMQMVENVPFMHSLAEVAMAAQGKGRDALATCMVAFAASSLVVGLSFWLLGHFKLGNATYFFPRHVILGCIGGIGLFVVQTGLEVATKTPWKWDGAVIATFGERAMLPLWLLPLGLELLLRVLLAVFKLPMLPPFYFVAIPPAFYAALLALGIPADAARAAGYFFDRAPPTDPLLMWKVLDLTRVDWAVLGEAAPTIVALTLFSIMHVPINVPSLSMSTHVEADMNHELKVHGLSNALSGAFGGLQNYLCYSNSLLYDRCGGGSVHPRAYGGLMSALLALFFFIGPNAVSSIPRAMAACLLFHVGADLVKEALVDSLGGVDAFEYASIVLITTVMSLRGMTAGLAVGVMCGTLTFTIQQAKHAHPIRGAMTAATIASRKWRCAEANERLRAERKKILVVQLQGTIFFGNSTPLADAIMQHLRRLGDARVLLLDFTLVTAIDSSATETVAKLAHVCFPLGVQTCFCRGDAEGFPCAAPLSERLSSMEDEERASGKTWFHLADDLDAALEWCEDQLLHNCALPAALDTRLDIAVRQMHALLPKQSVADVEALVALFRDEELRRGEVLWRQGSPGDFCCILLRGRLLSEIEDEAGTREDVSPGAVIGEFHLISGRARTTTVTAVEDAAIKVLDRDALAEMHARRPELALLLDRIAMGYLERRLNHVMNRIWESHCVPI